MKNYILHASRKAFSTTYSFKQLYVKLFLSSNSYVNQLQLVNFIPFYPENAPAYRLLLASNSR